MSSRHWCVTLAEGYWKRFVDTETSVIACLQAERVSNLRPNERTKGCDDVNFIRPIAKGFDWREYDGFRCPVPLDENWFVRALLKFLDWIIRQKFFLFTFYKDSKDSIHSLLFFFSFFFQSSYSVDFVIFYCSTLFPTKLCLLVPM